MQCRTSAVWMLVALYVLLPAWILLSRCSGEPWSAALFLACTLAVPFSDTALQLECAVGANTSPRCNVFRNGAVALSDITNSVNNIKLERLCWKLSGLLHRWGAQRQVVEKNVGEDEDEGADLVLNRERTCQPVDSLLANPPQASVDVWPRDGEPFGPNAEGSSCR